MTVVADDQNRVTLPSAHPGDRFELVVHAEGKIELTPLNSGEAVCVAEATIEQRDGFSVGVLNQPINEQAIAEFIL